ncbi:unnamed protein product [Sphagnum tenellum]
MTKIIEARQKLDKTLASHGLSDIASLRKIVLKQLEKSSPVEGGEQFDQLVEKKSNQLFALLEDLRSAKGERGNKVVPGEWKLKQDTSILRVMYREGPEGTPYHSLCMDGLINGPMATALCVGWEAPLYKQWWPQFSAPAFKIVESRWLKRNSVGGDLSLLRFKVPWPLAVREILLSEYELEYFEENLIVVMYSSAPDKPDEKLDGFSVSDVPRVEPSVVRMDVTGGFAMQKIGPDRMFFRLVCDLDMKLDFVPPWLINFIARQLVGHGHKLYQKAISSVKGSAFENRLEMEAMYLRIKAAVDTETLNGRTSSTDFLPSEKYSPSFHKEPFREGELESLELAFRSLSDRNFGSKNVVDTGMRTLNQRTQPEHNVQTHAELHNGQISSQLEPLASVEAALLPHSDSPVMTISHTLEQELRPDDEPEGSEDAEVAWALRVLDKLIAHFKEQNAVSKNRQDFESIEHNRTAVNQMHLNGKSEELSTTVPASVPVEIPNGTSRPESTATLEHRNEGSSLPSGGISGKGWHKADEKWSTPEEIGKDHKVLDHTQEDGKLESVEAGPLSDTRRKGYHFHLPFRSKRKHRNKRGNQAHSTSEGSLSSESKSNQFAGSSL